MFSKGESILHYKPKVICKSAVDVFGSSYIEKTAGQLLEDGKRKIVESLHAHNLTIRNAEMEDIPAVEMLIQNVYSAELAGEISRFDFFRILRYGEGVLLEQKDGGLMGCLFNVYYDTPEKTAFSLRLGIKDKDTGKGLAYNLMIYSYLKAIEHGATVMRALIDADNFASLHLHLNNSGWFCDTFSENMAGLGTCFTIQLPLNAYGMTSNIVDIGKTIDLLKQENPGLEYALIQVDDIASLNTLYSETDFKVVAFLKAGLVDEKAYFLAFPKDELIKGRVE